MPEILTEIRDAKQAMKDVAQRIGCLRDELMASIQQSLVEYNELCDTRLELREGEPLPEKRKVGRPKGTASAKGDNGKKLIEFLRKNGPSSRKDILEGTNIPLGSFNYTLERANGVTELPSGGYGLSEPNVTA
jgi:hypothetical protein